MDVQAETPLSRRERERLKRRREILDAALAVFAERGYGQATLDEVAQRAEFGKGTLYNYFEGGKEGILFAIFDEIYDEVEALIGSAFDDDVLAAHSMREAFESFFQSAFAFYTERRDLFVILMREAHRLCFSDDADKVAYFHRQRQREVELLLRPIEIGIERGEIRPLPPIAIAHTILGNIDGMMMHLNMEAHCALHGGVEPQMEPHDAGRFLTTLLFDGLLTGQPATTHRDS